MEDRIPLLSEFIKTELERIERSTHDVRTAKTTTEKLNEVFRAALIEAWDGES